MVGPGDVDDELEAETKEECAKYGEVNKCLIFEVFFKIILILSKLIKKMFDCFFFK